MTVLNLGTDASFCTTGAGNQRKKWITINGVDYLVKLDSRYREASKEVSVSKVLDLLGLSHAVYTEQDFYYDGKLCHGCITRSYSNVSLSNFTLADILEDMSVGRNESALSYFTRTVTAISTKTGLRDYDVSCYLCTLLALDYIFMNPDRHLTNIEFLQRTDGAVLLSPYYDFGQSFLHRNSMMSKTRFIAEERKFKTRPFSSKPEKNLISTDFAKSVATLFQGRMSSIENLDIPDFHKFVIRERVNRIMQL